MEGELEGEVGWGEVEGEVGWGEVEGGVEGVTATLPF